MKIALECQDIILENSLSLFLEDYLVLKKDCDFLICDKKLNTSKPQFIIGQKGSLEPPFSKEKLISELESFNSSLLEYTKKQIEQNRQDLHKKVDQVLHGFRVNAYEQIDILIAKMKKDLEKVFKN